MLKSSLSRFRSENFGFVNLLVLDQLDLRVRSTLRMHSEVILYEIIILLGRHR